VDNKVWENKSTKLKTPDWSKKGFYLDVVKVEALSLCISIIKLSSQRIHFNEVKITKHLQARKEAHTITNPIKHVHY